VLAGAIAAIMTTANSFLVLAGAALVRDLPRALGRKRAATLAAGRWSTLLVALAAAGFAFLYDDLVALLGSFSFGLLAAALAPTVGLGLAWKRAGALAALGSIWTGLSVHLLLELGGKWVGAERFGAGLLPEGLPPAAAALLASTAVLLLLGWLRPAPGGEQPGSGRRAVGRPDPVE
jgi:Na+/proline symporter